MLVQVACVTDKEEDEEPEQWFQIKLEQQS